MATPRVTSHVLKITNGAEQIFTFSHENISKSPFHITIHYVRGTAARSRDIVWGPVTFVPISSSVVEFKSTPTFKEIDKNVVAPADAGGDGTVTIVFTNPTDPPGGATTNVTTPAVPIMYS